jgi:hypothetical protein
LVNFTTWLEVKKGKGGWEALILKLKIGLFKTKRPPSLKGGETGDREAQGIQGG